MNNEKVELELDPTIKTAIIYAIEELHVYSVEIKEGDKSYYLKKNNEVLLFGNMKDARDAAVKEHVKVAYLALNRSTDDTNTKACGINFQDRYDYLKVDL